jgi:pimeloyl-ACP methyl ester carboxylesterase
MHVVSSTDDQRETVVLLHSSAASARQWDALIAALSGRYLVRAIDLHGHGAGAAWHGRTPFTLADDAALVAPLLVDAGSAHLVGHSYGGAVALKLATQQPGRVKSIVAYEPVLFRTLFKEDSWGLPARDVRAIADLIRDCLRIGKPIEAGRRFVDFWSGRGGFDRMAPARLRAMAERLGTVLLHFEALLAEAPSTGELQRLAMPRLFVTGTRTVATTRRLGELLRQHVPSAAHESLPGSGHLGPITHAAAFNARVAAFLAEPATALDCAVSRAMARAWMHSTIGVPSAHRGPVAEIVE